MSGSGEVLPFLQQVVGQSVEQADSVLGIVEVTPGYLLILAVRASAPPLLLLQWRTKEID